MTQGFITKNFAGGARCPCERCRAPVPYAAGALVTRNQCAQLSPFSGLTASVRGRSPAPRVFWADSVHPLFDRRATTPATPPVATRGEVGRRRRVTAHAPAPILTSYRDYAGRRAVFASDLVTPGFPPIVGQNSRYWCNRFRVNPLTRTSAAVRACF